MSDEDVQARIKGLIEQEHRLRQQRADGAITSEAQTTTWPASRSSWTSAGTCCASDERAASSARPR